MDPGDHARKERRSGRDPASGCGDAQERPLSLRFGDLVWERPH